MRRGFFASVCQPIGFASSLYTIADANSLASSNLASPLYHVIYPANDATADVASIADGADGITRTYYINRAANAGVNGVMAGWFLIPTGTTSVQISFDIKLPTGVAASTVAYGLFDGIATWAGGGPHSAVASGAWVTVTRTYTVVAGVEWQLAIQANAAGTSPQAKALVRNIRVIPQNGTGLFAAPFTRYDLPPEDQYEIGRHTVGDVRAILGTCMQRAKMRTPGGAIVVEHWCLSTGFPNQEKLSVFENGPLLATIVPSVYNKILHGAAVAAGGVIDVVAGSEAMTTIANTDFRATAIRAVYVAGDHTARRLSPQSYNNPLVTLGDSIPSGYLASPSSQFSYMQRVRMALSPRPVALETWGFRTMYYDAHDAGARAASVAILASYFPNGTGTLWVESETNDWGTASGALWSAASYGAGKAAWVDDFHAVRPNVKVVLQTAFQRAGQASNNTFGANNALEDYRQQTRNIQAARSAYSHLCEGTALLPGTPVEGTHPNNAESVTIATNIETYLSANGL